MNNLLYIVTGVYNMRRKNNGTKKEKKRVVVSKSLVSVVSYAYAVAWLMTGLTDTISKSWLYQAQRDKTHS